MRREMRFQFGRLSCNVLAFSQLRPLTILDLRRTDNSVRINPNRAADRNEFCNVETALSEFELRYECLPLAKTPA